MLPASSGDLNHRGNVAHKAAMRRDAEPMALGQLPSPAGILGSKFGDPPQAVR
jgi:hypothetical protein